MKANEDGLRLRIFIHESLRYRHQSLYEYIIELARREGVAGATAFRAIEGYGIHRHIHTTRLVDASDDLPITVEIIDTPEMVRRFMAVLDESVPHGTVTVSPVHIVKYSAGEAE